MVKISLEITKFFKKKFLDASQKVLDIYHTDFDVHYKADKSPLTLADLEANEILTQAIQACFPNDFIVSEELKMNRNVQLPSTFWLIDPIDGTKEFVNKTGDFTLNIGYVEKGAPVWGMVYSPIYREFYYGGKDYGITYEKNGVQIHPTPKPSNEIIALISRNHFSGKEEKILNQLGVTSKIPVGSSLKICKLAINQADIYLRLGETSEWDIAPADALLTCSGGTIITQNYQRLYYGKPNLTNPPFIAFSSNYLHRYPDVLKKIKNFDFFSH